MTEDSTKIYPIISESGNRRVLRDWISNTDSYTLSNDDHPITEADADLCITDKEGLLQHSEELIETKTRARPALLPVLLLLSERDTDVIETDRGEIADNVLVSTVDEVVSLPMRQAELEWRIEALLRLRRQSLELQNQTKQLRRFQEAVEASGHAIFITDPEGTIEYVNPAFEDITGYDRSEVIGETPDILNSGKMSVEYYEELWETIATGTDWRSEIVDRRKDGTLYTAYQTIAPITDDEGDVNAFVAVQTDITERKELENELKRHRDIVQRLDDPIMLQDESGNFDLVNEALTDFSGLSKEELLGEDEYQFMTDDAAGEIEANKNDVLDTESPMRYTISPEFEHTNKDAVFSTSRYPYYNDDGDLTGTIAICRDVTDLEERTRQLQVMDNILRHNLRNDLMVVRGLADQIRLEASDSMASLADDIIRNTEDLMATGEKSRAITDLLSDEPQLKEIDITNSIRFIAEEIANSHPDTNIEVDLPEQVTVSTSVNIREAIEELVRNAMVHNGSKTPSVDIGVEFAGETAKIHVIDNGPGLPAKERDVLETGMAIDDLYHGSGLGLWLVYWIVKRSNGKIEVTDLDSLGTEITITLPTTNSDSH